MPVDDGVDKLNRKYTLLVFLFLALPIFTKQYIGDPIECFAPVYFAEHQSRYINSYCWTQSTYYMVPVGDPDDDGDQVSSLCTSLGRAQFSLFAAKLFRFCFRLDNLALMPRARNSTADQVQQPKVGPARCVDVASHRRRSAP